MENLMKSICFSAKRALRGQTPKTLRGYSFDVDLAKSLVLLRVHFGDVPSEDDLEQIAVVETEIDADFLDDFEIQSDTEIVVPGEPLSFLAGGIAYLREGEPGTVCTE